MASIQEVSTSSKHLSFKIRVCLGRDGRGKQHFKTMKWHPPEGMTPAKARKEVQMVAAVWEAEQLASADLQEAKVEESTISYTFGRFVDEVCKNRSAANAGRNREIRKSLSTLSGGETCKKFLQGFCNFANESGG